jgi:hypothetical protein
MIFITKALLTSSAATPPPTPSMPSHHEETKYDHRNHEEGEDPPKTIPKPCTWKHMVSPPFALIGRYRRRFAFSAFLSAFWRFLCLSCFRSLCSLILAHHSPHHGAAVDGTPFTWATGFHHFSHFLKISAMRTGVDFLGLLLVNCLFGLQGGLPPF